MATLSLDGGFERQSFTAKYRPKMGTSQMTPNIAFPHTSELTSGLRQCWSSPVKRASVTPMAINDGTKTMRVAEKVFELVLVESIAVDSARALI